MLSDTPMTDRISEQAEAAASLVRRFIIPLFKKVSPGVIEFVGSGFLLQISDHHFLVSAAHVFDHLKDGVFLLAEGREQDALSNPVQATALPASGKRADDVIDIGFIQLTSDEVNALGRENFLARHHIAPRDAQAGAGTYLILGYPEKQQKRDHRDHRYLISQTYYWAPEAKDASYHRTKLERGTHILINYDPNRVVGPKGVGGSPSFYGMSGSATWRLRATDDYRPDNLPKLVGILLGRTPDFGKELMITRISLVLEAVRAAYPALDQNIPRGSLRVSVESES